MDDYALAFSVSNLGPKKFLRILNEFNTLEKGWNGTKSEFQKVEIIGKTYDTFDKFRKNFSIVDYKHQLEKEKVTFIAFTDKKYPEIFRKLENPPIGIYCKGNISLLPHPESANAGSKSKDSGSEAGMMPKQTQDDVLRIAVVGTRKITSYGRAATESIVSGLVSHEVCIISGLALGVDATAHRAAIEGKGTTIAVLACGVDCCTPSENYSLYSNILKNNGMILSEYPLSQPPNKGTFLARNRIVAALSDGVLITEAAEDSGSLVTAEWGFDLEKKVFAVPGQINSPMSQGGLKLLKKGAKLVTDADDVLQEFSVSNSQFSNKLKILKLKNLSKEEKIMVSLLESEEMTMDEIFKLTGISISQLFGIISGMELKGIIKNNGGKLTLAI